MAGEELSPEDIERRRQEMRDAFESLADALNHSDLEAMRALAQQLAQDRSWPPEMGPLLHSFVDSMETEKLDRQAGSEARSFEDFARLEFEMGKRRGLPIGDEEESAPRGE